MRPRNLTIAHILKWADDFHRRARRWPIASDGRIPLRDESWGAINVALGRGNRGLPGGSSLAKLLKLHRGVPNRKDKPPLDEKRILTWARDHFRRTGGWPTIRSGSIPQAPHDTWLAIDKALRRGTRGLSGQSSLANLLAVKGFKRHRLRLPNLTEHQILAWADAFFERHGSWPYRNSEQIAEFDSENWHSIDSALSKGARGLPGGSSLPALLNQHRGLYQGNPRQRPPVRKRRDPLSEDEILKLARAHRRQTGTWPNRNSGPVQGRIGFTWSGINTALKWGKDGLPGGSSLAQLIQTSKAKEKTKRS